MTAQRLLLGILIPVLLVSLNSSASFSTKINARKAQPAFSRNHVQNSSERNVKLPPGVSTAWWDNVQDQIRRAEYNITWQTQTYLSDLPAAYQAPNRANNLRTYFTPKKSVVIPRVWEKTTPIPPWRLEIDQTSLILEKKTTAAAAAPQVDGNRIEYSGGELSSWYRNEEAGLQQGFTIASSNRPDQKTSPATIGLKMTMGGDLTPRATLNDRIIEFIGKDEKPVLRYGSLQAEDAKGRKLRTQIMLAGPQVALRIDSAEAVFPVKVQATLSALPNAPSWTVILGYANSEFGARVATAGDVNDDGYSDIIVGAPKYDGGLADQGQVLVFHGSTAGLASPPVANWNKLGGLAGAQLGAAVATAGDVNGDGYADVIIGAPYYTNDQTEEGRTYVYHGSRTGLGTAVATQDEGNQDNAHFGMSVATAGDVNGDGYADVIVGATGYSNGESQEGRVWVWHGSASGLSGSHNWRAEINRAGAFFGVSVSTAGDVNGDGYADIIVGAFGYSNGQDGEGAAFVWLGSAAGVNSDVNGTLDNAAWKVESNRTDAGLGVSVSLAGDVNGDGFSDVIVGIPYYGNGQVNEGACWVFHGSAGGLSATADWTYESNTAGAYLGLSVATAGDVNGDGYADIIAGAYNYSNGGSIVGKVWVWHGSFSGLSITPSWFAEGWTAGASFGKSVATAGDVNGDGYSDIIIGAPQYSGTLVNQGAAYVYYGSAASLDSAVVWTKRSANEGAFFGWSVGTAGDVNGDGYADIIVGAYGFDGGLIDQGGAWVYHGSDTGLPALGVNWHKYGEQEYAWFGYSVGTAGDVNGDGYSDIIVGSPYRDRFEENEGSVWVYHGSPDGVNIAPAWYKYSNQAGAQFGYSVGTAGDVNGDGYSDIIVGAPFWDNGTSLDEGGVWLYHGSASGLISVPAFYKRSNQAGAQFGYSVGTAGDVNGDGYSDIIVGAPYWDDGYNNQGGAWVYHGSAAGVISAPAWYEKISLTGARFGFSVGTAGDVNGDGYSDVIVGTPYYGDEGLSNEGKVWVFHGAAAGLSTTAAWSREGGENGVFYGYAVGTAGDVNGDGFADVIIGAPLQTPAGGVSDEGTARVYLGSPTGLQSSYAWLGQGGQTLSWYGNAVGTAGDVNGDGYADVIVGSKDYNEVFINEGRVYVYYGNASKGVSLRPRQTNADGFPLAQLGRANRIAMRLNSVLWTPFGRGRLTQDFEIRPFGVPLSGASTHWLGYYRDDFPGTELSVPFNLAPERLYHWRIRTRYYPGTTPFMPAGRWFSAPWNGMNEADFRSGGARLLLPLIMRQ